MGLVVPCQRQARERGDSRRVRGVGKRRGRGESWLWPLWPPFLRPLW